MDVDFMMPPGPPGLAADAARRAHRLGFDGFFTAETKHDPFLPLGLAATAAPGLTLGTAIAVAFPRSPMVTAQTAWDLHSLSGGRFILGLGTQVKPHIVRRFSTEWTTASGRLGDYIGALRAIWTAFDTGEPLRFESDSYRFSLLTPFFRPDPIGYPHPRIAIAGVGPGLGRLAGAVCDGFHAHAFHTVEYLDRVVIPSIATGAAEAGRDPSDVEIYTACFVVTGRDQEEMNATRAVVRQQIAFYASTPTYRGVLDLHGWDFGDELNRLSRRGEWGRMADLITDEVVDEVAVVAPIDELGAAIRQRYEGRISRIGYYTLAGDDFLDDARWEALVAATRDR